MLKQSSLSGLSTVFYDDFAINLPDMAYAEERTESAQELPALPDLTPLEQKKAQKKLDEIRKQLKNKLVN